MTTQPARLREEDQRVTLHGVPWDRFETILDIRGDDPCVRITYLEGELEMMSPSHGHEWVKKVIARLIETYATEKGLEIDGVGSWTLRSAPGAAGVEPDECYIFGSEPKDRPDLALEVVWTPGGLGKLEVYARLGIPEVWFWQAGRITVHRLGPDGYTVSPRSLLFPDLDIDRFATFVDRPSQTQAVRDLLAWIRQG